MEVDLESDERFGVVECVKPVWKQLLLLCLEPVVLSQKLHTSPFSGEICHSHVVPKLAKAVSFFHQTQK